MSFPALHDELSEFSGFLGQAEELPPERGRGRQCGGSQSLPNGCVEEILDFVLLKREN